MSSTSTILPPLRLGVNIDHVATLRNARGDTWPDPLHAATIAAAAGADGITVHLREDRRHIRDEDVARIKEHNSLPLNLEMAATDEMLDIALKTRPHACCIVPEKREELTTEGGLDVTRYQSRLQDIAAQLHQHDIKLSLFIDADPNHVEKAADIGADIVEFHTGAYAHSFLKEQKSVKMVQTHAILRTIVDAATLANTLGIEPHAGHGLTFENVGPIAAIPHIRELNIGHFIIAQSIFMGLGDAITTMRHFMDQGRDNNTHTA